MDSVNAMGIGLFFQLVLISVQFNPVKPEMLHFEIEQFIEYLDKIFFQIQKKFACIIFYTSG